MPQEQMANFIATALAYKSAQLSFEALFGGDRVFQVDLIILTAFSVAKGHSSIGPGCRWRPGELFGCNVACRRSGDYIHEMLGVLLCPRLSRWHESWSKCQHVSKHALEVEVLPPKDSILAFNRSC